MKKILPFFSYLLHPVFMPFFAALFYLGLSDTYFSTHQQYLILIQIAIITIFIPVSFFFLLRSLGKVDSVMLSDLSQRKIPLLIQTVLLYILISKSITADKIQELHFFLLAALATSILALLLTFLKIKASLHMMGISALTVFVILLGLRFQVNTVWMVSGLVLLNGIVASSRLVMKAHSEKELVIGFCCGAIPQLILLFLSLELQQAL